MSTMPPQVALESTVISHGLPYPANIELAIKMEEAVAATGAQARTVGILSGILVAGLSHDQITHLASASGVRKVSRRDMPIVSARRLDGATTVAATMWIANHFGIETFATGGIGGVHRGLGGAPSNDISADLLELAQTPVIVVCAGAKAILDLSATLEFLETHGVTVIGYQTDSFPAFYSRSSGLPVDVRCDTPAEIVEIWRAKRHLGLTGGLLVANPIPIADEIPAAEIEPAILQAVDEAITGELRSAEVTPFLLSRLAELTGERSVRANIALLLNNARLAGEIAVALRN